MCGGMGACLRTDCPPDLRTSVTAASAPAPSPLPLQVRLLARSIPEYLHRAAAEEEYDNDGKGGAVAEAVAQDPGGGGEGSAAGGATLYRPGAFVRSGYRSLDAYLTREVWWGVVRCGVVMWQRTLLRSVWGWCKGGGGGGGGV